MFSVKGVMSSISTFFTSFPNEPPLLNSVRSITDGISIVGARKIWIKWNVTMNECIHKKNKNYYAINKLDLKKLSRKILIEYRWIWIWILSKPWLCQEVYEEPLTKSILEENQNKLGQLRYSKPENRMTRKFEKNKIKKITELKNYVRWKNY